MLRVRRPRFEPRPRRARTRPDATPAATVEMVVSLRRRLTGAGLDAGADTIVWHLEHHHQIRVSRATVYRILRRQDLVAAEPAKKPRSSYVGFQAEQPNETWQADFERHEAFLNLAVVKGHRHQFVAADWLKLRAA